MLTPDQAIGKINDIFNEFDWELDDRQYALEKIERVIDDVMAVDDPRLENMCALYTMRKCVGEADKLVCGNICQRVVRAVAFIILRPSLT